MTGQDAESRDRLDLLIAEFGPWATLGDVRTAILRRSVRRGLGLPESASDDDVAAAMRARLDALDAACRDTKG